jgi:hypothetical protein
MAWRARSQKTSHCFLYQGSLSLCDLTGKGAWPWQVRVTEMYPFPWYWHVARDSCNSNFSHMVWRYEASVVWVARKNFLWETSGSGGSGWYLYRVQYRVRYVYRYFDETSFLSWQNFQLHVTSRNFTSLHFSSLHFTSLHFTKLHRTSSRMPALYVNSEW